MILLIALTVLCIGSFVLSKFANYSWEEVLVGISAIAGLVLAIALFLLPITYYSYKAEVDRYYALKETIEQSREENVSEIERAALVNEIATYNKDLASVKYWNDTIFDIYIYDGLAELPFLE